MDIEEAKYKSRKVIEAFDGFGDTESYEYTTAIEMILKELDKYKNMYESEKYIHELRNRQLSEYEKTITAHQKENMKLNLQLLKKDKVIDEMSKYISESDISDYFDFCKEKEVCDELCEECIRKGFERKVENDN